MLFEKETTEWCLKGKSKNIDTCPSWVCTFDNKEAAMVVLAKMQELYPTWKWWVESMIITSKTKRHSYGGKL